MKTGTTSSQSIDEYIAGFPAETQKILEDLRALVQETVPDSTEKVSYGMPTFNLNGGYLVYFAAWKKHIAFYPVTPGVEKSLGKEIAPYRSGKGTLKFPLSNPMPISLITKIVQFRATEARVKSTAKKRSS